MLCPNCSTELLRSTKVYFCPRCSGLNLETVEKPQIIERVYKKCSECKKIGVFTFIG